MQIGGLSTKEAAQFLRGLGYRISVRTLYNMRNPNYPKKGPPYFKFDWGPVGYHKDDLIVWAASHVKKVG